MVLALSALLGGDWGIYQTVSALKSVIRQALNDPSAKIRLRAESLLSGILERDYRGEVESIFQFVQDSLHYVSDPTGIELIKNPILLDDEITRTGYFMGDCDDASGYLAALLQAVGYNVALVISSPVAAPRFDYRHIYVRVYLPKEDTWLALDPTAKTQPIGWEVPNKKERMYPL